MGSGRCGDEVLRFFFWLWPWPRFYMQYVSLKASVPVDAFQATLTSLKFQYNGLS